MSRQRLEYGRRHGQHADLWVPDGSPPATSPGWPVVVLLHGGFWKAVYTKSLMTPLAADIMDRGWAAWNLEYRRVGTIASGGWPGTFEDVGAGIDHLATVAEAYHLDLGRVVTVGHSAGGHLALWAGGRGQLPPGAPGSGSGSAAGGSGSAAAGSGSAALSRTPAGGAGSAAGGSGSAAAGSGGQADAAVRAAGGGVAVPVHAAVGLAPVSDLVEANGMGLGGGAVARLMGGPPERHPERYALCNPAHMLPLGISQVLVHGDSDGAVPLALSRHYVDRALAAGDPATLVELAGVNHMELIDPASAAWSATLLHLRRLLA